MNLAHLHLLLNHFPIIGSIMGLALLLVAIVGKNDDLKPIGLGAFVIIALLAIPTFLSGFGAAGAIADSPGVSQELIEKHAGAAMLAFLFLEITGAVALVGLWRSRGLTQTARRPWNFRAVLILSVVTVGLMARTGNIGGEIRHPEIQNGQETAASEETIVSKIIYALEPSPSKFTQLMLLSKWWFAFLMDLHFVGLVLLFATIGVIDLRVLGFLEKVPIAALNKFVPWGIAGFGINFVTGFLVFMGTPLVYSYDTAFWLKMLGILLAGGNLLAFYYTSAFRDCEALKPGDDAPWLAKFIAGSSLLLWSAVIILGRYIQFFEGSCCTTLYKALK